MNFSKASTGIFIDKYHPKSDGKCAISIRVTHDRKKRYYQTPVSLSLEEFEKVKGFKPRKEFKAIALQLQDFEKKAADTINKLKFFTWEGFERNFLTNRAAKQFLDNAYIEYVSKLKKDSRIGTASSYECSRVSLKKFAPGCRLVDITPEFLRRYEQWMLSKGNSITTVGIYLRSLRTIINLSIAEGTLTDDLYPFGKQRYEIPTGNNIKKALNIKDIGLIYNYKADHNSTELMAKNYWLFMYFCNGMNVKDMCLLKYSNIKG
jgi:integrase/recombinase XerD